MAYVRQDRKAYRLVVVPLGGRGTTHASAVLQTGVLSDSALSVHWAVRKQFTHTQRESLDICLLEFCTSLGVALGTTCSGIGVGQAFGFSRPKCCLLDQQALPLVSFARVAPFQDNRR